jgi:hypothetical protein
MWLCAHVLMSIHMFPSLPADHVPSHVTVYRVDRGDHLEPRQRWLFRNTAIVQVLQLAANQQDAALRKVSCCLPAGLMPCC